LTTVIKLSFKHATGNAEILLVNQDSNERISNVWSEISSHALLTDERASTSLNRIIISWAGLLRIMRVIHHLCRANEIQLTYDELARQRLETWVADVNAATLHGPFENIEAINLDELLTEAGWDFNKRTPTREQRRDLLKLLGLRNGAVFSVPGSGKTSVAIALHQIVSLSVKNLRLLVVAPINAFNAWDDVIGDCLVDETSGFVRLVGGATSILNLLSNKPRYAIISYGQVGRLTDSLIAHLIQTPTHIILDESHRIKAGSAGFNAREILQLSTFAFRREILSGTPMPQSRNDLEPQFEFLFPACDLPMKIRTTPNLRSVIRPLYVRTKLSELDLPRPDTRHVSVDMSESQRLLYAVLRDDVLRQHAIGQRRQVFDRTSVMRLLQASIDPQTAAEAVLRNLTTGNGSLVAICNQVLMDGICPRLSTAIQIVRESVEEGKKIVVWVPFTSTIEKLALELADLGSRKLYGATPTGSITEIGTREQIIAEFHESADCNVLIANPAAGGEGISLHKVCHHALYVGRTFNATHYMQSRDRINRLGLPVGVTTKMTIIECRAPARVGSIDMSVRRRLDLKIDAMGDALDDDDLRAIALESDEADQVLEDEFTFEDLLDLLSELAGSN